MPTTVDAKPLVVPSSLVHKSSSPGAHEQSEDHTTRGTSREVNTADASPPSLFRRSSGWIVGLLCIHMAIFQALISNIGDNGLSGCLFWMGIYSFMKALIMELFDVSIQRHHVLQLLTHVFWLSRPWEYGDLGCNLFIFGTIIPNIKTYWKALILRRKFCLVDRSEGTGDITFEDYAGNLLVFIGYVATLRSAYLSSSCSLMWCTGIMLSIPAGPASIRTLISVLVGFSFLPY